MNKNDKNSYLYLAITLGLLTAFAPFVTDFYLPSLPSLTEYFKTKTSLVQMSLTMSMMGLALGQLFVGPISDKYGRKKLLISSLILFFITTFLCIMAPSIHTFNICRLFQGMAASGGLVISRSVATDSFRGKLLSKFLAVVSAINGIAPVMAPVLGGIILKFTNWKGTFIALVFLGICLIILCSKFKETLSPRRRSKKSILSIFSLYGKVLKNGDYCRFLTIYAMSSFVLFAYISSSPFIFQTKFGFSPMMFSFIFGLNAISIGIGCAIAGKIANDLKTLKIGGVGIAIASIIVFSTLYFGATAFFVEVGFILLLFCFGLLQPPAVAQTLMTERRNGGTASALMGALGFIMGSIASPLVGIGNVTQTTGIAIIISGFFTLICTFIAVKKREKFNELEAIQTINS